MDRERTLTVGEQTFGWTDCRLSIIILNTLVYSILTLLVLLQRLSPMVSQWR